MTPMRNSAITGDNGHGFGLIFTVHRDGTLRWSRICTPSSGNRLGALIAIAILFAMGRLRTERYEGEVSDAELENMLQELAQDAPMESEMEMTTTGPSMDYDSDSD